MERPACHDGLKKRIDVNQESAGSLINSVIDILFCQFEIYILVPY